MLELIPLAERVGHSFARREPKEREDYLGCSRLGLVQAIQWICEGRCPHDNVQGYVVETCKRFCMDYASMLKSRGQGLGDYWEVVVEVDGQLIVDDILPYFTAREQEIILNRMAGCTNTEIAERLGITKQYVGQILDKIREKYERIIL